jgi:hypothetical protein
MGLKIASRRICFVVAYIGIAGSLWAASQWWEKGMAARLGEPDISPGGCYRVETLKPFWVLPNILHPRVHPDELDKPEWFPWWGYPGFFRLYDHRTGKLISETRIYDLETGGGGMTWGAGSGEIFAGMIPVGPNVATRVRPCN